MKKFILALVLAFTGTAAHAADIYRGNTMKDDTPALVRQAFEGVYAGVSVSWNSLDVEHGGSLQLQNPFNGEAWGDPISGSLDDMSGEAIRVGAQFGYHFQIGRLYGGPRVSVDVGQLDADMSRTDTFGDASEDSISHTGKLNLSMDYLAAASLKLGIALTDNIGVYGVGGLSVAGVNVEGRGSWSATNNGETVVTGALPWQAANNETRLGYHVGGGVDFVLGDWQAFAEYAFHDLGSIESNGTVYGGLVAYQHEADVTINVFKVGVNRRF